MAVDGGEGSRRETLDLHACRRIWEYLGSAIESKKVLSKMYPRDYRVRESTCTSAVVGVEMAPVEYRTRRSIHATRDNEEGSKARLQSGDAGIGSARQRIRQAAKHGTVWRLGFTHVSAFETARHGGAVPWSKGPEPNVVTSPVQIQGPFIAGQCPSVFTGLFGASETLRVAMLVQIMPRLGGGPRRLAMIHDP